MQKLKLTYAKTGPAKYLSHLDWMQVLERALRRTVLPIKYSEGFNPRMRIEYGPPLPIGVEGLEEILILEIDGWIRPPLILSELAGKFPEGIKILKAELANPNLPSLDSSAQSAEYIFELSAEDAEKTKATITPLLQQTELLVDKKSKAGIKKTNVRPMIFALELIDTQLRAALQTSNHGTLRPRELCEILKIDPLSMVRRKILFR